MSFNPKQSLKTEIEQEFGKLTARQLWVITKLAKFVRLRCRNNTAFNNAMNEIFPHARFRTVNKTRVSRVTGQPETYPGLEITTQEIIVSAGSNDTVKVAPETISGDEVEE